MTDDKGDGRLGGDDTTQKVPSAVPAKPSGAAEEDRADMTDERRLEEAHAPQQAPATEAADNVEQTSAEQQTGTQQQTGTEQQTGTQQQIGTQRQADGVGAHPAYYSEIDLRMEAGLPWLYFIRAPGPQAPPAEFRAFRKQVEDVARLSRILFQ